jgi:hypothetical protein
MRDLTLTKSERFLLNEVDSVPDKVVGWSLLKMTAGRHLTNTGYSRIMDRLLRRNMLARDEGTVTLTFAGMCALKEG